MPDGGSSSRYSRPPRSWGGPARPTSGTSSMRSITATATAAPGGPCHTLSRPGGAASGSRGGSGISQGVLGPLHLEEMAVVRALEILGRGIPARCANAGSAGDRSPGLRAGPRLHAPSVRGDPFLPVAGVLLYPCWTNAGGSRWDEDRRLLRDE